MMEIASMNTENPLVSVVIPCLNRAHYLVPTIESVLSQDYHPIECIVVDGGSTDDTVEILRQYGNRIKWVSEPDKGHADAVNKGWHMSRGDILAWLNADDLYVVPQAVSKIVAHLQRNQQVDVVYGDYTEISEDGEVVSDVIKPREWDLASAVKYCHYTIPQATSFMRRSILEKVGWLDAKFGNGKDHELWLRIGMVGTIEYAPFHIARIRNCPGLSQRLDMGQAKVRVTEKFFRQPDLPAPFNSGRFKRRAMSNSYLVGGVYIWVGTRLLRPTLRYLVRAFIADPLNCPYILGQILGRFSKSIFSLLPLQWRRRFKQITQRTGLSPGRSTSY
jgi:glycosyltransferase involved in cell wall biosynthesis